MADVPQLPADHWALRFGFIVGVVLGGLLLIGELLSIPMIGAIVVSILPGEQCSALLENMAFHIPWVGLVVVAMLVTPITIGRVASARLLMASARVAEGAVGKMPGGKK